MSTYLEEYTVEVEPTLSTRTALRRWRYAPTLWLVGWLAVAGGFLLQNWTRNLATPAAAREVASVGATEKKFESREIKDIRTGMRVIADNPDLNGQDAGPSDINPQTWRNIHLRMKKPNGGELLITLLRPLEWLKERRGAVGRDVELNLEELGIAAPATILAINPCPRIESGDGRVVTGTFQHSAANVIDLYVSGEEQPIGTTANHPFWSETRREFVPAGGLELGEELRTANGKQSIVTKKVHRSDSTPVFILEVDAEHTYLVTSNGLTVHNGNEAYVTFAHGTSRTYTSSIKAGLSETAGRANSKGGSYSKPGAFHVHEIGPPEAPGSGIQLAYEWALRHDPNGRVAVMIGRIPRSTYDRLRSEGKLVVENVGVGLDQTVFKPDSYKDFNTEVEWL